MFLALVGASILAFALPVDAFCYWLDGRQAPSYSPCYALDSVGASMCCDGADGFKCTPPGICMSTPNGPVGQYDNGSSYWRAACSDNTWQDPACLAMGPWETKKSIQLSLCADMSYCPRDETGPNTTCCDNNQGQFGKNSGALIAASLVSIVQAAATQTSSAVPSATASTSPTSSSPKSSTASSVTSSSSSTASAGSGVRVSPASSPSMSSSPQPPPPSSNNAWIAGAVVGPIAAIALVIAGILLLRRRKKQMHRLEHPEPNGKEGSRPESAKLTKKALPASELAAMRASELGGLPASELGTEAGMVEMQGGLRPVELETGHRAEGQVSAYDNWHGVQRH